MLYKRYIQVITLIGKQGELTPLYVIWDDGIRYEIDKILEIRHAISAVGGTGILYRCLFGKTERSLFFEQNRWFMETSKQ